MNVELEEEKISAEEKNNQYFFEIIRYKIQYKMRKTVHKITEV